MTTPHEGPSRLRPDESERDRHLAPGGRKRILALDGGGVRGLVTLGLLRNVEARLKARSPNPDEFRLSDYFDLIGGTSTGSIIAVLLALGYTVEKIEELYRKLAPKIFDKHAILGWPRSFGIHKPKFDAAHLKDFLDKELGDLTLESPLFKTGFALATKRFDTGSLWLLSNHPDSKFWEAQGNSKPNKLYSVAELVRASAAAPYYFDAAEITISDGSDKFNEDIGLFLDGAVGGANNPSLHLLVLTTLFDHPFQWTADPESIFVLSIGTGTRRFEMPREKYRRLAFWGLLGNARRAATALQGMIRDAESHTLTVMQALSLPTSPQGRWKINGEIGTMPRAPIGGVNRALCTFHRIDAPMVGEEVSRVLTPELPNEKQRRRAIDRMEEMDNARDRNLSRLLRIGRHFGAELKDIDLPRDFDPPPPPPKP